MKHEITKHEAMIDWFRNKRDYKITSYRTICRYFWFMGDMRGVLKDIIASGHVRKLARGYRAEKNNP